MSGITLYAKDILAPLPLGDVILLKVILAKDEGFFNNILKKYNSLYLTQVLKELEDLSYIKILKDEITDEITLDDIVVRSAAEQLFKEEQDSAVEVLEYLNSKIISDTSAKKGFSTKSSANKKFITARLAEGYTVEDLKAVVDTMAGEWLHNSYHIYLRPETLFNSTKFQGYLVRANTKKDKSKEDWNVQTV